MTNLTHAFTFRKAPVFAAVLAIASAQTGTSAETTKVDTKSQKTERPTRSPQVALQQQSQTKLRVRGGKMETRMQDGKLVVTGFAGAMAGGKVQLTGNVPVGDDGSNRAALKFADVSVSEAGQLIGRPELVAWLGNATLSGQVKGSWAGQGVSDIGRSADGALAIVTGPGEITDPAVLKKLGKAAGISELGKLRFNSVKLHAHAKDGTIVIDSATIAGPDLNLVAAGNYSTSADELDLKIAMAVSPEIASKSSYLKLKNVFGFFKGEDDDASKTAGGFIKVPVLLVSGDLKKPDVKLDKSSEVADAKQTVKDTETAVSSNFKVLAEKFN